jgi:hypothetical protein
MNKRIEELIGQAMQSHYGVPVDLVVREKAVALVSGWGEKFAELIIAECARVGGDIVLNQNEDNDMGVFLGIKSHFGVR